MINKIESNLLKDLDEKGIITIKGFLDPDETKKIKDIVKYYSVPKGHHKSYFSTNFIHLALKIVKLDFVKLKHDIQILRLARTKKLNYIADKVFKQKSYLKFVVGNIQNELLLLAFLDARWGWRWRMIRTTGSSGCPPTRRPPT